MSSTFQVPNSDKLYENEMHNLNTELQIALLKWRLGSIQKKTLFKF